jgi:hypothetical protein
MIDWNEHKFRCSALGNITALGRGVTITDKQTERLNELLSKVKLTDKQAIERDSLVAKRDAPPELSQGAKTYLQKLWVEKTFGRYKEINTKYMTKGTEEEHTAILMANRVLGWGLDEGYILGLEFEKKRMTNEWISGETDLDADEVLADVKCPWDIHTFPYFGQDIPSDSYYWQGQGYMMLTGHTSFELVYCLVDTPERLIQDEIRRVEWQNNYIEIPAEHEEAIRNEMTFSDIPEEQRIRRWKFNRDWDAFNRIIECVKLSRKYLTELNGEFLVNMNHNPKSI